MKRKFLAGLLITVMAIGCLAGCGNKDGATDVGTKNEQNDSDVESDDAQAGDDVSDSSSDSSDDSPSDTASEDATSDGQQETESGESETTADAPTETLEVPSVTTDLPLQDYQSVVMVGNTCYEVYNYVEGTASTYAETVNELASQLDGKANLYDVIIPTSMGITFPDNLESSSSDMKASMDKIVAMLGSGVKVVNPYDTLMAHRLDYIFFRTDHHWTGLGAYYAYKNFCESAGIQAHDLSEYDIRTYEGFLGSFYNDTDKPDNLKNDPDRVDVYVPVTYESASMTITDKNDQTYAWPVLCDVTDTAAGNKYGTFIGGDNPMTVIENSSITDGSACVVVKESFGNAFVPYLLDHYQTVYVIDYRYWSGNLTSFVSEKGIKDVILCNNISMIRNKSLVGKLAGVIY